MPTTNYVPDREVAKRLLRDLRSRGIAVQRAHNAAALADFDPSGRRVIIKRGQAKPLAGLVEGAGLAAPRAEIDQLRRTRDAAASLADESPAARVAAARAGFELRKAGATASVAEIRKHGASPASVAAFRAATRPGIADTREQFREVLKSVAGGKVPPNLRGLLRTRFENASESRLQRLRQVHARLIELQQARGADGAFKTGTAISPQAVRAAYRHPTVLASVARSAAARRRAGTSNFKSALIAAVREPQLSK